MSIAVIFPMADRRFEARDLPVVGGQRSRACRSLFGARRASAIEESRAFVRQELAAISEDQRKKWNFDFESETPLAGRYQWERVEEGNVPEAYRLSGLETCRQQQQQEQSSPPNAITDRQKTDNTALRQTFLPDYMKTRKRRLSSSSQSKCQQGTDSDLPKNKLRRTVSS